MPITNPSGPSGMTRHGARSSIWLVIMRVRSACDNVRLPEVKSGLQRSLMTADAGVGNWHGLIRQLPSLTVDSCPIGHAAGTIAESMPLGRFPRPLAQHGNFHAAGLPVPRSWKLTSGRTGSASRRAGRKPDIAGGWTRLTIMPHGRARLSSQVTGTGRILAPERVQRPVTNQGKDGPLRGAMPGMKLGAGRGLRVVCRGFAGWGWGGRCMLGLACRPSSPVHFGPFEAVTKFGAGIPVAGHARCCCERVCQSPD